MTALLLHELDPREAFANDDRQLTVHLPVTSYQAQTGFSGIEAAHS